MQSGGAGGTYFVTNPDSAYRGSQKPELVFHRYGNEYFLARIGTTESSCDLPPSAREREVKKTIVAAGRQMQTEIVLATP